MAAQPKSPCVCQFGLLLLLLLTIVPGAQCSGHNIVAGIVASVCASFFLLIVVIAVLVLMVYWNTWYPKVQYAKGKVKMPREYWKKKRQAAKMRLKPPPAITTTAATTTPLPLPAPLPAPVLTSLPASSQKSVPYVQNWVNVNRAKENEYEELGLQMQMYEEKDNDDVRIETTVCYHEDGKEGSRSHTENAHAHVPALPSTAADDAQGAPASGPSFVTVVPVVSSPNKD